MNKETYLIHKYYNSNNNSNNILEMIPNEPSTTYIETIPKVFASGSCRLVRVIDNGHSRIEPIHSMFTNFYGINFLGKLHNVKQHIQFIKFIKDDIIIPPNILKLFLTSYGTYKGSESGMENKELLPIKKSTIKEQFNNCKYYIFEICSIKLYEKDGHQVQFELTDDYNLTIQTEEDLYNDLIILRSLIPENKQIILQVHFRPNIIHNDPSKVIKNREIIFNVINKFCKENKNTSIFDINNIIKEDISLYDGHEHVTNYKLIFDYLYVNFLNK
jgi:hypothetical protein